MLTEADRPKTRKACHLLLVEDDADTREWLCRLLDRYDYDVRCAGTLADGISQLSEQPCCVLLDANLPDGSGIEILRAIRTRSLPMKVALISGNADAADAVLLKPDVFFIKPIDVTELVTWLSTACR